MRRMPISPKLFNIENTPFDPKSENSGSFTISNEEWNNFFNSQQYTIHKGGFTNYLNPVCKIKGDKNKNDLIAIECSALDETGGDLWLWSTSYEYYKDTNEVYYYHREA